VSEDGQRVSGHDASVAVPAYIAPMKATLGELPFANERDAWSFEVKWDGMRVVTCTDGARVQMWSGNHIDVTVRFPELHGIATALAGRPAVLDGEVVAFDAGGRPDFSTMQTRMHVSDAREAQRRATHTPVLYVVFDVMHFDGHGLVSLPWHQRVAVLDSVFEEGAAWQRSAVHDDGAALLEAVTAQQLEGIMAKRRDSPYTPGRRSPSWRKIKVRYRGELVVGGWLPGTGTRSGRLGALLVGYHDDAGRLRFAGRVGSGFSDSELSDLGGRLADLATDDDPFEPPLRRADAPGARFVRPELVVEVAFADWTPEGRLRHPSYLGRRFDKDASDVTRP
jgi:bifunctional non-homologous end joining protein LigD